MLWECASVCVEQVRSRTTHEWGALMVVWACVSVAQLRRASVFVGGRKSEKIWGTVCVRHAA
jgi:hypothetical protein